MQDIMYRLVSRLSVCVLFFVSVCGRLHLLLISQITLRQLLYQLGFALLVGGILIIIYRLSDRPMGIGDVLLLTAEAINYNLNQYILVVLTAFLTCAAVSAAGMAFGKWKMHDTLPFAPFLCFGIVADLLFKW